MRRIGVKAFGQAYQLVSFYQAAKSGMQSLVPQKTLKARSVIHNVLAYCTEAISGWAVFATG